MAGVRGFGYFLGGSLEIASAYRLEHLVDTGHVLTNTIERMSLAFSLAVMGWFGDHQCRAGMLVVNSHAGLMQQSSWWICLMPI
jgi:hypothetical protein